MSSADLSSRTRPSLGYFLKRAQHAFRTRVDDALRPLGLTAPQYAVIAAVELEAGISNAELARTAFVTPQTMQSILSNLERAGLLKRTAHPDHGRILRSELTERGRRVLNQARALVQEIEQLLIDAVGAKNTGQFADMLSRCAETLADDEGA